jgi:hypothetical protein
MAFKVVHLFFAALLFTLTATQPPDASFIWRLLCTNSLPAEPARNNFPLKFEIFPDPLGNSYRPNESVRVVIRYNETSHPDFSFGGFLILAHPPLDFTTPVGRWIASGSATPISCSNENFIGNDHASQTNPANLVRAHELIWVAPSTPGTYVFNLTTLEVSSTYWADQISFPLRVV